MIENIIRNSFFWHRKKIILVKWSFIFPWFIVLADLKDSQVHLEALELPGGDRRGNTSNQWTNRRRESHDKNRGRVKVVQDLITR